MTRSIRFAASAVALAAALAVVAPFLHAQRREDQTTATVLPPQQARMVGNIKILNVRNNVWVLMGAGGNITALVFPEGITLVDSGLEASADQVLAALKTLTDKPIIYIINTHVHPDHTGGNLKLAKAGRQITGGNVLGSDPGATQIAEIIGHENVLERMGQMKPPPVADATPATTYHTPYLKLSTLYHGDAIQLFWEPAAHTDGDTVVWFRGNDVLATGDIFTMTNYPRIDVDRGGSINGEIDALNHLIDVAFPEFRLEQGTLIVPGHGRLSDIADLVYYRDMVTIIRDRVQDAIKKGMSLQQTQALKLTRDYDGLYAANASQYSPDQFIEAVYRSLSATLKPPAAAPARPAAPARK
jgi:glyoxylase-like metal-dependent hydrolase (beta-lactamase superfamily II)